MIDEWEDYYRVLQVHYLAEAEVIKAAYLRLSKKYHPDNAKGTSSEEKIKSINKAYEVLSNTEARNEYTKSWLKKLGELKKDTSESFSSYTHNISIQPAQIVLINYLTSISNRDYESAYELLTQKDKKKITIKEFSRWQALVGEVFTLLNFTCEFHGLYKDIRINHCNFDTCIKMVVHVVEENHLMERKEEDGFYKNIVFENDKWCIYLGYTSLKGIIEKFSLLAQLRKQKETHSYDKPIEQTSKEFFELARREQMRYNRYGNVFTMVFCKMNRGQMEELQQRLAVILRRIDVTCMWTSNTQLILLPETTEEAALLVVDKIKQSLNEKGSNKRENISFYIMQQRFASLDELMAKLLELKER